MHWQLQSRMVTTQVLIILFGSSSIALSFLFQSMLNTSYVKVRQSIQVASNFRALAVCIRMVTQESAVQVFAPIAFVSSLIGVTAIGWLVRKSGRAR